MKSELTYLKEALDQWNKTHKWDKGVPITPAICAEVLTIADALRTEDRKRIETEGSAT